MSDSERSQVEYTECHNRRTTVIDHDGQNNATRPLDLEVEVDEAEEEEEGGDAFSK
jgi:hypothetical protein